MEKQFLQPDKQYKTKTIILLILCMIAGLAVAGYFHFYLQDIKELAKYDYEQALAKMLFLFKLIMISMAFTFTSFGIYIIRISIKTIISKQFPPPGMKVIKKTELLTGKSAKTRGLIGVVLAIAIIITGISFPAVFYVKIDKIFQKPVHQVDINQNYKPKQGRIRTHNE